jgi:hypothetical protein
MITNSYEDLSGDFYHTTLGEDGDIISSKQLRISEMVVRNIIFIQQRNREQGTLDQRILFRLAEGSFIAWKAEHFHATPAPNLMPLYTKH